jgi:hypothetical protein
MSVGGITLGRVLAIENATAAKRNHMPSTSRRLAPPNASASAAARRAVRCMPLLGGCSIPRWSE